MTSKTKMYKTKYKSYKRTRKILMHGEIMTLQAKRCKEVVDALKDGLVTMDELRVYAARNHARFNDEYVDKVLAGELFPPKEISQYIWNKNINKYLGQVNQVYKTSAQRRRDARKEAIRLTKQVNAKREDEIIASTFKTMMQDPVQLKKQKSTEILREKNEEKKQEKRSRAPSEADIIGAPDMYTANDDINS